MMSSLSVQNAGKGGGQTREASNAASGSRPNATAATLLACPWLASPSAWWLLSKRVQPRRWQWWRLTTGAGLAPDGRELGSAAGRQGRCRVMPEPSTTPVMLPQPPSPPRHTPCSQAVDPGAAVPACAGLGGLQHPAACLQPADPHVREERRRPGGRQEQAALKRWRRGEHVTIRDRSSQRR